MSYTSRYTPETLSRDELDQSTGSMAIEFGTNWCGFCQGAQADIKAAMDNHPDVPHVKIEDGKEIARVVRPDGSSDIEDALLKIH